MGGGIGGRPHPQVYVHLYNGGQLQRVACARAQPRSQLIFGTNVTLFTLFSTGGAFDSAKILLLNRLKLKA